jgi:hypothetical protein
VVLFYKFFTVKGIDMFEQKKKPFLPQDEANFLRGLIQSGCCDLTLLTTIALLERHHQSDPLFITEEEGFLDLEKGMLENFVLRDGKLLKMTIVSDDAFFTIHEINICGERYRVGVPKKIGRKKLIKSKDFLDMDIQEIFDYWLEVIGNNKELYKRTPKLTKSKEGRYSAIKNAIEKMGYDKDSIKRAIDGCRRSLYHMGYNRDGTRKDSSYYEPINILRNSQRIEEMQKYLPNAPFNEQLKALESKNEMASSDYELNIEFASEDSIF